jgi:hypothetical protein
MKLQMKYRTSRLVVVASFAAVLTAAGATPTAAQQVADSGATAQASRELLQSNQVPARPLTPNATLELRVIHWSSPADQVALILGTGLGAAAAAEASAAQTDSPDAPLLGPRLRPEVRGVNPIIAAAAPMAPARNNTIVISTLALVLIAVIVTILVVK